MHLWVRLTPELDPLRAVSADFPFSVRVLVVNKRPGRVRIGPMRIPRTVGPPLLSPLGVLRDGVPAREFAEPVLKRPEIVSPETRHALGIAQGQLQPLAIFIEGLRRGFGRIALEGLIDKIEQLLKAELCDGQCPAQPDV